MRPHDRAALKIVWLFVSISFFYLLNPEFAVARAQTGLIGNGGNESLITIREFSGLQIRKTSFIANPPSHDDLLNTRMDGVMFHLRYTHVDIALMVSRRNSSEVGMESPTDYDHIVVQNHQVRDDVDGSGRQMARINYGKPYFMGLVIHLGILYRDVGLFRDVESRCSGISSTRSSVGAFGRLFGLENTDCSHKNYETKSYAFNRKAPIVSGCILLACGLVLLYGSARNIRFNIAPHMNFSRNLALLLFGAIVTGAGMETLLCHFL